MSIALIRVDERLVHGQVTVGWGTRLQPDRYVLVDDDLSQQEWEQELYRLAAPETTGCDFVDVDGAREGWTGWSDSDETVVVLFRDLDHVSRLAESGLLAGRGVNLGGIHHRDGRTEVVRYLFLDEADRERIRGLRRRGTEVWGQDLPGSPRVEGDALIREARA